MDSDKSVTAHFVEVTESEGGGLEAPGEEWRIKGFPLWIVGILAFIGIALAFLAGRKL